MHGMYLRLRWELCTGHPDSVYSYAVATAKCHVGASVVYGRRTSESREGP
ncbi:hypothetical protein BH24ACI4_BH24ACI4_12620 [soil metagenome]